MSSDAIKIDGLKKFSKDLKKLDSDLPKMLRLALNEVADVIVDDAKPDVPHRSGKAARSVKAKSTRTAVRVAGGGSRAPYYPWLDFGGRVGRKKSVKRPFKKKGRYIYAAYFRARDSGELTDTAEKALLKVVQAAGIEVD